ncbi:MAG: PilZ domain-containing protein [Spirochaetes bacterium]|nr:PilZ domain-containing protein [Spirochaetota bacterium]
MGFFERRKSPRFSINKKIELLINENLKKEGILDNISDTGCLIIFDENMSLNLKDKVKFNLRSETSSMEFRGTIIRIEKFLGKTKIAIYFDNYY